MKANLFILIALFACVGNTFGQLGYGPEVGAGIASMKFSPLQTPVKYTSGNANPIFSGKIGCLIDVPLNKHLSFQSGAYVVRKGAVRIFSYYDNDSSHEEVQQSLYLNYVEVPVTLLLKSGVQGKGRITGGIGPALAYVIGGKNKVIDQLVFNGISSVSDNVYPVTAGNTVTGFDLGLHLSLGYESPTGLFFRAAYTHGTQNIGVGDEIDKNRAWSLGAGYLFGKGRNINKEIDDLIDKGTK